MVDIAQREAGENVGHANNFNILRLIAASLVIISHAYGLSHPVGYYDEDKIFNSQGIGWAAVNIFFIMSGYLIGKSVFRSPNIWRFCKNRALRIYPGLIFCTLLSITFLGIVFRSGDFIHYAASVETLKFTLGNSTAVLIQFFLPGVFVHNVYPGAVNGSLWSLPFELGCYAIVGGLLATGILRSPKTRLAAFLALLVFYVGGSVLIAVGHFPHSSTLNKLHRLTICFGLGMFYAEFRDRFPIRFWHVAVALTVFALSSLTPILILRAATGTLALGLTVFWVAFLQTPFLVRTRAWPDWSYGVYIYAFPIQQLLKAFWPDMNLLVHIVVAFLLVLIPASLSWHFVERPALSLKNAKLPWR